MQKMLKTKLFYGDLIEVGIHLFDVIGELNGVMEPTTDFPAYSDTTGTREKCHCNQIVTVTRGS